MGQAGPNYQFALKSNKSNVIKHEIISLYLYKIMNHRSAALILCLFILGIILLCLRDEGDVQIQLHLSKSVEIALPVRQRKRKLQGKLLFVHVGKTGGSTVEKFLTENRIRHQSVHTRSLSAKQCLRLHLGSPYKCTKEELHWKANERSVIVSVRDPLRRLISAFNWRHTVGGGVKDKSFAKSHRPLAFKFEVSLYKCFDSVNDFAEALGEENNLTRCGSIARSVFDQTNPSSSTHMSQGYLFYIGKEMLEYMVSHQFRIYLVRQESLTSDLHGLEDWLSTPLRTLRIKHERSDYPRKNDTYVSEKGLQNLKKFLQPEYDFLRQLENVSDNPTTLSQNTV